MRKPSYCLIKQRGGVALVTDSRDKEWWHAHCYCEKSPNKTTGLGQDEPSAVMSTCQLMELVQKNVITSLNQSHHLLLKKRKKERKKAAGRKRRKKERLLSIYMKSILNCLSCTTKCKHIDQTVTFFFFWNIVFITQFWMKIADVSKGDSMVHKQIIKQSTPRVSLSI